MLNRLFTQHDVFHLDCKASFKHSWEQMEGHQLKTKVTERTEWVNPLVTVMKSDQSLRICLDP